MGTHAAAAGIAERRSSASSTHLIGVALAGVAATMLAVWPVWFSPLVSHAHAAAVARGLLVACYVGVGLYTWSRRPGSRVGPLIAGAGLLYSTTSLAAIDRPLPHTLGRLALAAQVVYFAFLFVSFPRERPATAVERRFVVAAVGVSATVWAVNLLFADTLPHGGPLIDCTTRCPDNALQVVETPHPVTTVLGLTATVLTALIVLALIVLLARKAASATLIRRRLVVPLLYASIMFAASYATYTLVSQTGGGSPAPSLRVLGVIGAFSVPLALLYGQLRERLFAAASLWRTMGRVGPRQVTPERMEAFLGETLGDPSLALALWSAPQGTYVDVEGEPVELPEPSERRSVTRISRGGSPSLALVHDAALDDDVDVVRGLGGAAATLLENAALVDELQASRARIVESAEQERHRLERDLHDGAQQRLTSIQIKLALAREHAPDGQLAAELDEVARDAARAASELRALAHGIYPPLLHDAGLGPALRSLAGWATIPIRVVDRGIGRAAAGTELAIYFCALEALQNVSKHGGEGTRAVVTLSRAAGEVDFEVRDDGIGFEPAPHANGIGLVSMRDRIGAIGGRLDVRSSPGGGTTVSGSVPAGDETDRA